MLDRSDVGGCIVCTVLTLLTGQFIGGLLVFVARAHSATPGICKEGRLDDISPARVAIDVPLGDVISIECLVPVAVYDESLSRPQNDLRQLGTNGMFQIPFEFKDSGVACIHQNASFMSRLNNFIELKFYKDCEDSGWECNHGKCDAYQKALQFCLFNIMSQPYPCTYTQDEPKWGVRTNVDQLRQGILLFSCVAVLMSLSILFLLYDPFGSFGIKYSGKGAAAMLVFGLLRAWMEVKVVTSSPMHFDKTEDLRAPCTAGKFHMCAVPKHEDSPWNRTLGPFLFYAICVGQCVLTVGGLMFLWPFISSRFSYRGLTERTPLV